MMKLIQEAEINATINTSRKPKCFAGIDIPFNGLTPRSFEILLYQIFKARIDNKDKAIKRKFDNVALMQGVGEQGRDCILTQKGENVGLIQCKKFDRNLDKTELIKEITKFGINYILNNVLISDLNNFTYYIATSKGLTGEAISFISSFNSSILDETELDNYIQQVLSKYKTFADLELDNIKTALIPFYSNIKVEQIIPADLTLWLEQYDYLYKSFFKIQTVTDNTLLSYIITDYLSPILDKISNTKTISLVNNPNLKEDFQNRFKQYLENALDTYSSSQTLVFGNQQKKLEDFYFPLTLVKKNEEESSEQESYPTKKFNLCPIFKYKKVLIVDNGGMGKSTIMKWLFLSAIKQKMGIPIFIELRKLKEGRTVIQEIVSKLSSIDEEMDEAIITKLIAAGSFIFFFDGYDEISDGDRSVTTSNLEAFITKASNNLFLMTSRPETALNSFSVFQEFYIKKLTKEDAFQLIKQIGNNSDKVARLIKRLEGGTESSIDEFLQSPLLVSLLYKKFDYRETIPIKLQEFYHEVFEALFQAHDLTKGQSYVRDKSTKLSMSEFSQVLRRLAFDTIKTGIGIEYNSTILLKEIDKIAQYYPSIKLNSEKFVDDLVRAVPIFYKEGLTYKWVHKSFQEYFAAEYICRDAKEQQIPILKAMFKSERSNNFWLIFSLCYDIDYNSFCEAIIYPYILDFISYFNTSYKNFDGIIPKSYLDIRRSLTYKKMHYIIFKKPRQELNFGFSEEQRDETFPHLSKEYKIYSITQDSKYAFVSAIKEFHLSYLLHNKKNDLVQFQKIISHDKFDSPISFNGWLLDESIDNIMNKRQHFNLTNSLAGGIYALDINQCIEFIARFEEAQRINKIENLSSGF